MIYATSHVTPGVKRFHRDEYMAALAEARSYCAQKRYDIEIREGCEILYTDQAPRLLAEGYIPTMGGTDFVLVEFSPDIKYEKLREAIASLVHEGYVPVIAHAERYQCLTHRPGRVEKLKEEYEVRIQLNCSSIVNYKGLYNWYFINRMLKRQLADALGTDAHNLTSRPANMRLAWRAVRKKYGAAYAQKLTNGSFMDD